MNRKVMLPLVALIASVMMTTPLISTTQAKITAVNDGEGYTEYLGTLGGANFFVLIPDSWNPLGRMLVVICRPASFAEDPTAYNFEYPFAKTLAGQGFAVAFSNWGSAEDSVKEGVIRIHQLTEYVIDNYEITGKVFLFGTSLGGAVALLLGEKRPDVYSGVLDLSGVKDFAVNYNDWASYSGLDFFLIMAATSTMSQSENYFGGSPEEKPKAYQKYSPTYHADMKIPVISVVHVEDVIVRPHQTMLYHAALSDPSLHYIVEVTEVTPGNLFPGATGWYGHFDPTTYAAAGINFFNLVLWSFGMWSPP
jgi:dipeptidyl aminopeptidase/acylaminoacyl peptidase